MLLRVVGDESERITVSRIFLFNTNSTIYSYRSSQLHNDSLRPSSYAYMGKFDLKYTFDFNCHVRFRLTRPPRSIRSRYTRELQSKLPSTLKLAQIMSALESF